MNKEFKKRYRLKFSLEPIIIPKKQKPYKGDRKVFTFFNHYRRLYNEAITLKMNIIRNPDYLEIRNLKERSEAIYNSEEFQNIINIAKSVRKQEKRSSCVFCTLILMFLALIGCVAFYFKSALILLSAIPISIIFAMIFAPQISFKNFYKNIFVDICVFATGLVNKRKVLGYCSVSKGIKKLNSNTWLLEKKTISNSFKINTDKFNSIIEKMVIRDNVDHYSVSNGRIKVIRKKATIFSGYSFELKRRGTSIDGDICIAFINNDTLFKGNGLTEDELNNMHEIPRSSLLNEKWRIFVRNDIIVDKKLIKYIQKQVIALENNLEVFNLYFCDSCVRLLLSVKSNREGLMTSYFNSSLTDTKQLSFIGFYSNIKALYLYSCIEKIVNYMDKYKPNNKNAWKLK